MGAEYPFWKMENSGDTVAMLLLNSVIELNHPKLCT